MTTVTAGDALDRLLDEQHQIDELLQTHARRRRNPDVRASEVQRLGDLIVTLLRVHVELETSVLQPALGNTLGEHPAFHRAAARRAAVSEAIDRVETKSPRDPDYALEMGTLTRRARAWFASDEGGLFRLAREAGLDLVALDRKLAVRQEALLSAGRAN